MTLLLTLALVVGEATTIVVENASARPVTLQTAELPGHYEPLPRGVLVPDASVRSASAHGKLFVAHDRSATQAVRLHYADAAGNGCIFHVVPTHHSASWKKLKPRADVIGAARCEARTGRTVGDFVYVVR